MRTQADLLEDIKRIRDAQEKTAKHAEHASTFIWIIAMYFVFRMIHATFNGCAWLLVQLVSSQ